MAHFCVKTQTSLTINISDTLSWKCETSEETRSEKVKCVLKSSCNWFPCSQKNRSANEHCGLDLVICYCFIHAAGFMFYPFLWCFYETAEWNTVYLDHSNMSLFSVCWVTNLVIKLLMDTKP